MIARDIAEELIRSAAEYSVVTLLGPRQSGKTTPARMTFPGRAYFSFEDPTFTPEFLEGLERFRDLGLRRMARGAVLHGGARTFETDGVRVLNPLHVDESWTTLTRPHGPRVT